jgi:uncharacterized protein YecE (DUF72 family)
MEWRLGTMGFSYADWVGPFYPDKAKPADFLGHYAKCFDTVELDTTFYATPEPDRVRKWAGAVPHGFQFAVKAPKSVVQDLPLDRAAQPMAEFVNAVRAFEAKLGPVLIQFAPAFGSREMARLATFLRALPKDVRFAVEFRNSSWDSDETDALLRETNVCWAATHYVVAPMRMRVTTDFLYVRWIGQHDRFEKHVHEEIDVTPHLEWWKKQLEGVKVKTVWGFFNNDYAGYSVGTCNRFKKMMRLPLVEKAPEAQPRLFV